MGPTVFLLFQRTLITLKFSSVVCIVSVSSIFFFLFALLCVSFALLCVSYVGDFPKMFGDPWLFVHKSEDGKS